MKKCRMCNKEFVGSNFRVFNGKGSFDDVCSETCAKEFDRLVVDRFNTELDYYKKLHQKIESLDKNSDEYIKTMDEINSLEYIYGFSKEALA